MVHLGEVPTDQQLKDLKDKTNVNVNEQELGVEDDGLGTADENEFSRNVYGSRYAAMDLPKHEMPEGEMPREVAYRMIKDDLTLDGVPTLK